MATLTITTTAPQDARLVVAFGAAAANARHQPNDNNMRLRQSSDAAGIIANGRVAEILDTE